MSAITADPGVEPLLEATDVSTAFGGAQALRGVSLSVPPRGRLA